MTRFKFFSTVLFNVGGSISDSQNLEKFEKIATEVSEFMNIKSDSVVQWQQSSAYQHNRDITSVLTAIVSWDEKVEKPAKESERYTNGWVYPKKGYTL